MQTTSLQFRQHAAGQIRPLAWQLRASFDKTFDPSVAFFELDTSLLDGPDLLAPSDSNVLAQWDKYAYADYTDRVISIEVTREILEPFSIVQAFADVTVNNYDDYFTPNSGSPIEDFILPKRPFRILMGFGNEVVPVFVGLSEKMPTLDKVSRTATFHIVDFWGLIFDTEIIESTMILDNSTSEILATLLQSVGMTSSQYDLDDSFNRIPFFFVSKGDKLGPVIQELMEAEQGRLYIDELGIIRFLNRQNYSTTTVENFDKSNTLNYAVSNEDDIINSVKLTADILEEEAEQTVWIQSSPTYVESGDTVEIWTNLDYPSTSVTDPIYSADEIEGSHFISTLDEEGEVSYTGIDLVSLDPFGTACRLIFENTGASNAYIYSINLWGTPVKVVDTILVEDSDPASVVKYEEQLYELQTKYIQDRDNALSKAAILVDDYKEYGSLVDLEIKGNPALQIDDVIELNLDGYQGQHVITKVINGMSYGRYWQRLRAKIKNPRMYFILDQSLLDGEDVLSV